MNRHVFEGNWKQLRGKLRQQWGKLTDDDVQHLTGDFEQLAGIIQERYGRTKEQAYSDIDSWLDKQSFKAKQPAAG